MMFFYTYPATTNSQMVLPNNELQEKLKALEDSGLFLLDSGKVEINVNNGKIQNITVHKTVYRRDKEI